MERLDWCKKQKKGPKFVKPSEALAREYLESAEESLRVLSKIKEINSRIWTATTKYYIEYFAFYAFLMRIGVKSEIHSCTIELARFLENKKFLKINISKILEEDKELRIENQYYLKNIFIQTDLEKLRDFVLEIKEIIDNLTEQEIEAIRISLNRVLA